MPTINIYIKQELLNQLLSNEEWCENRSATVDRLLRQHIVQSKPLTEQQKEIRANMEQEARQLLQLKKEQEELNKTQLINKEKAAKIAEIKESKRSERLNKIYRERDREIMIERYKVPEDEIEWVLDEFQKTNLNMMDFMAIKGYEKHPKFKP